MRERFPKQCVKKKKQQKRVSVCVSHSQCFPVIALCFLRIVVSKHLFRYGVRFQIFFFSCVSVGSRACLCCSRGFNSCSNSFPALNFSRDSLSTPSRVRFHNLVWDVGECWENVFSNWIQACGQWQTQLKLIVIWEKHREAKLIFVNMSSLAFHTLT